MIAGATKRRGRTRRRRSIWKFTSREATRLPDSIGRIVNYTRDVGPPKLVGDPMLVKLAKPCYAASQGSGNVSFEVKNAWLMRERTPPYGPVLELPIYVGDTQETRYLKGPRGCPRDSEQRSFWTEQFKLGKRIEPAGRWMFVQARRARRT